MALNISNATYGRDPIGAQKLLNNLQGDIDASIKRLTGAHYDAVISNVKAYWVGEDADQFVVAFQKAIGGIAEDMIKFKSLIATAISNDASQFKKMQTANASNIR